MPPAIIHTPPALDSFTPLAVHQSQTPASFYGTKPVLHCHSVGLRAAAPSSNASRLPIFPQRRDILRDQPEEEAESGDNPSSTTVMEVLDAYISSE